MTRQTIICVTPNAALDRTLVVPDFAIGRISRIKRGVVVPGGKGLNMMRAVQILGGKPLSMGLMGGHIGRMVAAMVEESGYRAQWTWFDGETRTCTIIAHSDGNSTVINESGQIIAADWQALADDICIAAENEDAYAVCLCGSLPSGAPEMAPAGLIKRLRDQGRQVWVDSSNQPLAKAIEARPYAVKVNKDEISAVMGINADSSSDVIQAARALICRGIHIVVISSGACGAMLLTENLIAEAKPPLIQPVDPIASGDCLHAGIVVALAEGQSYQEAIRRGVAAGTVNALYAGGAQFTLADYQEILRETRVEVISA